MKVSEYLSKIRVRFKTPARTIWRILLITLLLMQPRFSSAQGGFDVFIDLEEEGTSPDDTKSSLTNNDGLKCDRTFVSAGEGSRNGTFTSPAFENQEGHVRQCLFTFVAAPGERVHLTFNVFNLRGTPPDGSTAGHTAMCSHEYIDLYTEIPDAEPMDLIHSPFGGRYCGQIPPRRRVSLYRTAVLGFFSDKNSTDDILFQGSYLFFKDDQFQVGTPVPRAICNFSIDGLVKRQGDIMTPTYPGVYPKDLSCAYKFAGKKGQRIRLEFRDFDTFYGGPHCPLDAVDVFDGPDIRSPLIGRYCGQQRNVVIYSTEHHLLVTFTTLKRTADSQNRGFLAKFEFSESFVKLDFISREDSKHDRGSECDQTILSRKGSSAVVYSPNYPFPYTPGIVCKYNIYGLQDEQHFERIRLDFEKFDIPSTSTDSTCSDGFLRLYLKGQDISVPYLYEKQDHELCSNNVSSPYWSEGQRLSMIFSSGQTQGSGFKARFLFATEYSIPGTPSPLGGCNFTYLSASKKRGEFNSPRHPARYPSNLTCTYNFLLAGPNEIARLYFDQFKVRANDTTVFYGTYCQEDWVEVFNVFPGGREVLLGRYCGESYPGPVESDPGTTGLKVVLRTDEEGVFNGFKARYMFDENNSINRDCGNPSVPGAASGVFTSPKWPEKYERSSGLLSCSWHIQSAHDHRILLHFQAFSIEGELETRGCAAAAVRVWRTLDEPPIEICGEKLKEEHEMFVSEGTAMKITFTTADKVAGGKGFRAVWTEVKVPSLASGNNDCDDGLYFRCVNSSFCIAKQLECDGVLNCGVDDDSDEAHCAGMVVEESSPVLLLTLGACALTLLMTLCIVCHRKRQRRRPNINHERRPFAPPPPFDTSSRPSMSLPSDIPSPPPPATLYTSLPPLSIDVGDNV